MKHKGKTKAGRSFWAERKRVRRNKFLGVRLFDERHGYIRVTRVWNQRRMKENVDFGAVRSHLVYEYVTDDGMRYIEDGFRLLPNCTYEDGKSLKDMRIGADAL